MLPSPLNIPPTGTPSLLSTAAIAATVTAAIAATAGENVYKSRQLGLF